MNQPRGIMLLLSALLAAPVLAQESEWTVPPPAWEGIWQGNIGTLPVHVCLNNTPYQENGAYYYDRIKKLITLDRDNAKNEWIEQGAQDNKGPRWRVTVTRDGGLAGTWNDGRKSLPILLKRIGASSEEYDGPCSSMTFHRPRLIPVRLTSNPGIKNGARFTTWTFKPGPVFDDVEISTFTLDLPGASVAKVNALLRAVLPKADGGGDWLGCMAGNANAHGVDGMFEESIEPTLITARWLAALQSFGNYCGGAHPNHGSTPRTFDLVGGVEVDPLDWFEAKAVHRQDLGEVYGTDRTLTPAFRAMILKGWKPDYADCADAMRSQDNWSAGIDRDAMVFSPNFAHAMKACGEDFKIPLARLQPWLNAKGKSVVATLPR